MNGLLFTLALLAVTSAQVVKFSKCPNYTVQKDFDPAKYFRGRFYSLKKFWASFEVPGSKCVYADYNIRDNGKVEVKNGGYSPKSGWFDLVGEAYCDDDQKAVCHVQFYPGTPYGDYNVLATDYDNYGLVYSCKETLGGLASLHYAWVLTRSKAISSDDMNKYLDMFKKNGVDISYFEDTTQDCSDNH